MRIQIASGFFCIALLTVSCKAREHNSGEVKSLGGNVAGICDKFLNESRETKVDAIYECKNSNNTMKVCLQLKKELMGTSYKVTYDAGNFADAFSVPSLKPLDNLTTRVEKPDASGLNLIARKIYNNGDFQFGYLDETRLEFKNSFQAVRVVKATAKEKNPTPTTRWDTVFAIDANSCKKLVSDSGNTGSSTGTGSIPDGIAPESAKYKCLTHESTRVYLSKEQCIQSGCASQYCIKVDAAL